MQPTNIKSSAEDISKISQTRSQSNEDLGGPGGKPAGGRHQEQGWKNFEKMSNGCHFRKVHINPTNYKIN